ncbi:hypothetical protein [Nocardioides alkalitolerans]|uniref:hypothetical protein n=1 Tax=Nocardioides alkalitolerans TaxID=281714 RepID=UPI000414A003|nr:hypothetical protein [Nocardioides alkalitolerans]
MPRDIRIAPAVAARLLGFAVVALALLVLLLLALAALLDLPAAVPVVVAAVLLFALGAGGLHLVNRAYVVRLGEQGYRVRFVRGAGTRQARWADVEDAVTTTVAGSPCVVLRLKDGRSTTIPVDVLAVDREEFVRLLRAELERGRGHRRIR